MKPKGTWILVCNGTQADVVQNLGPGRGIEPVSNLLFERGELRERNKYSDQPGRTFDSHGKGRHIMESPSDPKREAKSHFAQLISDRLAEELSGKKFDRLIVIAPPVMLGDLRKKFSKNLHSRIIGEIHKDLTHLHSDEIIAHIKDLLAT